MTIRQDMRAIKTVLQDGPATFSEISLKAGEGLLPALRKLIEMKLIVCDQRMIETGLITRCNDTYSLVSESK